MGKYLDIIDRAKSVRAYDINDINDKTHNSSCDNLRSHNQKSTFGRQSRLCRTLSELERRCPDHIEPARWHLAISDARWFLTQWGEQAEALGWSPRDLFGLDEVPANPHPSYRRLSRYDRTGLSWLLQGSPVVALTETTAAIRMPTGSVLTYRKHNKPAYGPLGDSLDDFVA